MRPKPILEGATAARFGAFRAPPTSAQQLTDENSKLKSELDALKAEVEDLKQTDQYLFSKAKEYYGAYKAGDSKTSNSDLRGAKELIDKLLTRFPNSPFKAKATELSEILNTAVAIIDQIEKSAAEIESAVSSKEFGKAFASLRSIKPYITDEAYSALAKKIDDEQNKPIQLSVLELLSDKGKYTGRKIIINGYISDNYGSTQSFYLVDKENALSPSVHAKYGHLSPDAKRRLLPLNTASGTRSIRASVEGFFDGAEIQIIKVTL